MSPAEREYQQAYRKRPEVLARDRARKAAKRSAPGGREANLAAVKKTYEKPESYAKKLAYNRAQTSSVSAHYAAKLCGVSCKELPSDSMAIITEIKREQLHTLRAVETFNKYLINARRALAE